MANERWIDRVFARIDAQYSGKFYASFPEDGDGINRRLAIARQEWAAAIKRKCADKERLAAALRDAVDELPSMCKYPPVLADLLGALDDALAKTRRVEQMAPMPVLPAGSGVAGVLEHLGRHAKSEVAQVEVANMRDIIGGADVGEITGLTVAEQWAALEHFGRSAAWKELARQHGGEGNLRIWLGEQRR